MKKKPLKTYYKKTKRQPIIASLAEESMLRRNAWYKTGCNAFNSATPQSKPLSVWTEQDILTYIKKNNIEIAKPYGDIIEDDNGKLKCSGVSRTGCIFCLFGCHLEKEPNRFQQLAKTHPKQYKYCIEGGEFNENGLWVPNKQGLGLGFVLDRLGVNYKNEEIEENEKDTNGI